MKLEELTRSVKGNVQNVDDLMGSVEAMALAVTTRAAAWLSTIPTVMLTSRTVSQVFNVSAGAGLVSSIALEVCGQATADLWLSAKSWNETRRKTDPAASERLALAMMTTYFVSDFTLVSVLELPKVFGGDLGHLSSLLFPIMQVVSTLVLTERAKQFKRAAAIEAERQERAATKLSTKGQPTVQPINQVDNPVDNSPELRELVDQQLDKRQLIINHYAANPEATQADVARATNCTPQYVSKLLKELVASGEIKRNGHGVEILAGGKA